MILKTLLITKKNTDEDGKVKAKKVLEQFQQADSSNDLFAIQFYENGSKLQLAFSDKAVKSNGLTQQYFDIASGDFITQVSTSLDTLGKQYTDLVNKVANTQLASDTNTSNINKLNLVYNTVKDVVDKHEVKLSSLDSRVTTLENTIKTLGSTPSSPSSDATNVTTGFTF